MWFYNGSEVKDDFIVDLKEHGVIGFVYCITDKSNSMKYIGKKTLFSTRKMKPLKGQKRRRSKVIETDWKSYYGSSEEVKQLVEQNGEVNFHREILRFCYSKGEMSYYEAKLQFEHDVLLKPEEFYNAFIGCKIHRNHVLKKSK